LFETLPRLGDTEVEHDRLSASRIKGYERHRLARGRDSAPTLLIAARDHQYQSAAAPIVLEHITVQYDLNCRIRHTDGKEEDAPFTVIMCTNEDHALRTYFLRVGAVLLAAVGTSPSRQTIGTAVEALVELFRSLTVPPRKTVQGLWAELLLIDRSRAPDSVAAAWHCDAVDRFDFAAGEQRIEVKSSAVRARRHHFSLDQLRPVPNLVVRIASLFVERSGGGLTLRALLESVRDRLAPKPDLALRLERTAAATLGTAFRRALDDAFDAQVALDSLKFFDPTDVPAVLGTIPPGVSHVHFQSDLSETTAIDLSDWGRDSLFGVMPPSGRSLT
jgi:hypothetical protein